MAEIECYIKELDDQRDKLAQILQSKGIEASEDEKYNSLVQKVDLLDSGGGGIIDNARLVAYGLASNIIGNATVEEG
jgi:hypothetical protein